MMQARETSMSLAAVGLRRKGALSLPTRLSEKAGQTHAKKTVEAMSRTFAFKGVSFFFFAVFVPSILRIFAFSSTHQLTRFYFFFLNALLRIVFCAFLLSLYIYICIHIYIYIKNDDNEVVTLPRLSSAFS